jgi:hypothetical protein
MTDEYEYHGGDTTTAAVSNNVTWAKVKVKNTIRYLALATVIIAFWHFFSPWLSTPTWALWVEASAALWVALPLGVYSWMSNLFIGAAAACVIWFMP